MFVCKNKKERFFLVYTYDRGTFLLFVSLMLLLRLEIVDKVVKIVALLRVFLMSSSSFTQMSPFLSTVKKRCLRYKKLSFM